MPRKVPPLSAAEIDTRDPTREFIIQHLREVTGNAGRIRYDSESVDLSAE